MSLRRLRTIYTHELAYTLKRPLFWFLVVFLFLASWGLSTGGLRISSGDASVGGTKAWLTSEFSVAFSLIFLIALLYSFFGSIAAGMTIVSDDDAKISDVLLSTPLKPGEYVWGKFLAVLTGFLAALALHLVFAMLFNHLMPNAEADEIRGPFALANYLRPALCFALPALIFYLGVAFYLGERFRRPITVFLFPIGILVVCGFFLWNWAPSWLDPRINRALMLIEPAGFRWLNETWLKLDRGAEFYNTTRIGLDAPFVVSRLVFAGLGLLAVYAAQRHFAVHLRGRTGRQRRKRAAAEPAAATIKQQSLASLAMQARPPGLLSGLRTVWGVEARNLFASPGIYLFGTLILMQAVGSSLFALGAFQTLLLLTPGLAAVRAMNTLSILLCLLMMFYTAESLERERTTLAPLCWPSPVPTAALLFGKALANSLVGVVMAFATYLGCAIAMLVGGKVAPDPLPFLLVWGLLLVPTLIVWTTFVTAVHALFGRRLVTYGVCLGALALTFYIQFVEASMSWAGNWWIWDALQWSDMGLFELDRQALVLNRLMVLGLAVFFVAVAVEAYDRRQADAIGLARRLQPAVLNRRLLRLAGFAVVPGVFLVLLVLGVRGGFQGADLEKKARDYWKQNLGTWKDAPQPALTRATLDVVLQPERRYLKSRGTFELVNDRAEPLSRFALTGGYHWENVRWTLNGRDYKPEDRSGLYVFSPKPPLAPDAKVRVGFSFDGRFPRGFTKNGGGTGQFILPSGVVLTNFEPSFAPVIGYIETVGVKAGENNYEPRVYTEDFYRGRTDAAYGLNRPVTTRITVTAPAAYTVNSVGSKVSEKDNPDGTRTVVWASDHPVRFFNLVAGRWAVRRGKGTAIYYHPAHTYNIDEMIEALDGAREHYSEWFGPYPWQELKLSEFPALAFYAQGFPTNITFSEGIGFLTESDPRTDAAFLVTAHESAHQWWANILTPGKGPGAVILAEGMSHFSTVLLMDRVKGPHSRMEFLKRIEERYGDERRADAERPLVLVDGSRDGDNTAIYDKGGWAFWMLLQHMGRERALAGLRRFIADWQGGPDFPVVQDFLASMRPFAPDPAAYDAFTRQWFREVVVPEYRLSEAGKRRQDGRFRVTVKVKNAGTGRMPVVIAAVKGERFDEDGKAKAGYRDARATVVLGPGEAKRVTLDCAFEPDRVVADPDVLVLQLRRKAAVVGL